MRSKMPVVSRPDHALRQGVPDRGTHHPAHMAGRAATHGYRHADGGDQRERADAEQPAAPTDQRAHRGGHRHADEQGQRLAAHHPAQRAAALAVGHAAGELGIGRGGEGAAEGAADGGPDGDPEKGVRQRLTDHRPRQPEQREHQHRSPSHDVGQPAGDRGRDAPGRRRQRHQVGDQRHADREVARHVDQEGRAGGAARGAGEHAKGGGADQGPGQGRLNVVLHASAACRAEAGAIERAGADRSRHREDRRRN